MPDRGIGLCAGLTAFSEPPIAFPAELQHSPLRPVPRRPRLAEEQRTSSPPPELPNLEWLRRVATAMLESTHSLRQLQQLRGAVSPAVAEQLGKRRLPSLRGRSVLVHSIRVSPVRPGVLEVGCTFGSGGAFYPMAFRMELAKGGWLATACEIGPH